MASRITSGARLCVRASIDKLVCNLSRSRHHSTVAANDMAVGPRSDRLQCYQKQLNRIRSDHQRNHCRRFTTLQDTDTDSLSSIDPYRLLDDDLRDVYTDIRQELELNTNQDELRTIATYYFDGQGKALRPMVAILMAHAINYHMNNNGLDKKQREVAMIAEMIHSASLIHDDVIDQSDFRRGKPSVNALWSHKKVAMAGDYILAVTSMMIARLNHNDVTITLSQIITDLVQGEFMQLGSKETENERFAHYLTKTYRKTASLIANSVKAEAMLAGADDKLVDVTFEYGRNIGLAFQLVDDLLDFVSSKDAMGKPTAADLKLGLATAPVLFACEKVSLTIFSMHTKKFQPFRMVFWDVPN